jgi:hypothetical protein
VLEEEGRTKKTTADWIEGALAGWSANCFSCQRSVACRSLAFYQSLLD